MVDRGARVNGDGPGRGQKTDRQTDRQTELFY